MHCNLSTLMGKARYNIQDVHEKTGLSRTTIAQLYHDKASRVDYDTVQKLCLLFDCYGGDIFTLDSEDEQK